MASIGDDGSSLGSAAAMLLGPAAMHGSPRGTTSLMTTTPSFDTRNRTDTQGSRNTFWSPTPAPDHLPADSPLTAPGHFAEPDHSQPVEAIPSAACQATPSSKNTRRRWGQQAKQSHFIKVPAGLRWA